jgi:hypothetical protein
MFHLIEGMGVHQGHSQMDHQPKDLLLELSMVDTIIHLQIEDPVHHHFHQQEDLKDLRQIISSLDLP